MSERKSSTSRCEDYSGCSPGRYGGRLRGIEMVFFADYRAAVSSIVASFDPVTVSDPTTQPSMALSIITGVDYFVSAMSVHPPCTWRRWLCCRRGLFILHHVSISVWCRWPRRHHLKLFILLVLASLASPLPWMASIPPWLARVAG
jgi:hypothetical protein